MSISHEIHEIEKRFEPHSRAVRPAASSRARSPLGWQTFTRYLSNVYRARLGGPRALLPLGATYHVTSHCNLNCVYCEDFGLRHNRDMKEPFLDLAGAQHVLRVLRTATENLILTGGEALMHPNIEEIVAHAASLDFRHIALITNGLLLPRRQGVLPHLSRLVISLDAVDPVAWDDVLAVRPGTAKRILDTIDDHARMRDDYGYQLVINCVVMPGTIAHARDVVDFCLARDIGVSISPQGVDDQPHKDLLESPDYRALIRDLLALKRQGRAVVGSRVYLDHMLHFEPFQCHPTLNVRVLQNGDFVYPCRPIAERPTFEGGVAANLLEYERFEDAFAEAVELYGEPPKGCESCFQQCFAEPSLLVRHPLSLLSEFRHYHMAARSKLGAVSASRMGTRP